MGSAQFDENVALTTVTRFVAADTTTLKALGVQNAPHSRVDTILVTNTDTIAHVVNFWWQQGGVNFLIGSVTVPIGQGSGGTPGLDVMPLIVPTGSLGLLLASGGLVLAASVDVAVTGAFQVAITCQGGSLPN